MKALLISSLIKNYVDKSISDPRKVILLNLLNEGFANSHFNTITKNFEIISTSENPNKLKKEFISSIVLNNLVQEKKFHLSCKLRNGLFIRNISSYKWWDIYNDKEDVFQNNSQVNDKMKTLKLYPQDVSKNKNLLEYIKHFITNLNSCQNDICQKCNSKLKRFGCETCVNNFERRVFNHQNLEIKQPDTISLFQEKRNLLLNEENTSNLSLKPEKMKKFDNLSETSQSYYISSQLDDNSLNMRITLKKKNGVSESKSKYDINNIFGRVKAKKGVVSDMIYDLSNSNVNLTVKDTSFTFDKSIYVTKSVIDEEESRRIKFTNVRHNDIISAHKSIGAKIQKENKIIVGLRDNLSNESPEKI